MKSHSHTQQINYAFIVLLLLITLLTLSRIYILSWQVWPVNGDETQYWSWAKHLDWGYYSKPPLLAWLIALTTHLFGNGIIAMRLASPLAHAVTAIFIYLTATRLWNSRVGFWSGLTYSLLPGVSFSSTIISTDAPLLMFWSIAFYCFIRTIKNVGRVFPDNKIQDTKKTTKYWIFAGIALGFAMLSKYAAIFFPLSCLLFLASSASHRQQLIRPGFYIMLLVAALMLIPNFLWNMHHSFASLQAVKANAALHNDLFHPLNLLAFLGSQFAAFGPILFAVFLFMLLRLPKLWQQENYKLCFCFILPVFLVMLTEALISRANGNWAATMYVAATVAVCAFVIENKKLYILMATLCLNILIVIGLVNLQSLVQTLKLHVHQSTTVVNWQQAGAEIKTLRSRYNHIKIIVDNRMLLTEIMYFGDVPLTETFKWNPDGRLDDQYDLVTHLQTQLHSNFLLWSYQQNPQAMLQRFKKSSSLSPLQLRSLDGRTLLVYVYYAEDFQGYS